MEYGLEYLKLDFTVVTSPYRFSNKEAGCYATNHPGHQDQKESFYVNYERVWLLFDELHAAYQKVLADVKQKDVVTSHAAFHYLTERYGLHQVAISGLSPDAQPSPKQLTKIISLARQKQIHYIFFEKRVNDQVAQVVTNELQAQPLILDPLEGLTPDEAKKGENYFTVAMRNLENLKTALQ